MKGFAPGSVVLRVIGDALARPCADAGRYVVACDVDARDGRGAFEFADSPVKAKRFPNAAEALAYWKRQSRVRPYRPDGGPNRPLTAYHLDIMPLGRALDCTRPRLPLRRERRS